MDVLEASTATEEIDAEDLVTEEHSSPEDPLVNLTKAPIPNVPESQVGQSIKTKVDVSNVRNLDTSKMKVQLINPHKMKAQDQRSLKTIHTPTQGQPKYSQPIGQFELIEGDYYSTELSPSKSLRCQYIPNHHTLYESSSSASFV